VKERKQQKVDELKRNLTELCIDHEQLTASRFTIFPRGLESTVIDCWPTTQKYRIREDNSEAAQTKPAQKYQSLAHLMQLIGSCQ
jgi:hypothetical protein